MIRWNKLAKRKVYEKLFHKKKAKSQPINKLAKQKVYEILFHKKLRKMTINK